MSFVDACIHAYVCTLTASTLSSCIILDQHFPCHPMTQGVQGVAGKGREGKKQRKGKREREDETEKEREKEKKKRIKQPLPYFYLTL